MADVNIPGLGHMKKGYVIAIAGGGLVLVIYLYRKQKANAAAATPATAQAATTTGGQLNGYPWDGTIGNSADPQSEDPSTGMTYAQEAAEGVGVYTAASGADTGALAGLSGVTTSTTSATSAPTTNAAWAQQATANLVAIGYSSTDVAAALGQYLASLPLTAAQQTIVQVALAEDGPPPVGSFSIITTGSSTATSTGTGSTSTGSTAPKGTLSPPTGLKCAASSTSVTLRWNSSPGANQYHYQILTAAGANVHDAETNSLGGAGVSGLKSKTAYRWRVAAQDSTGAMNVSAWVFGPNFTTT
jgi:hypothetical protein